VSKSDKKEKKLFPIRGLTQNFKVDKALVTIEKKTALFSAII